jgi:D-sedoheptulose 7-phosphate isomerase
VEGSSLNISELLFNRIRVLQSVTPLQIELIEKLASSITEAYQNGNKVLVFGNGGSAAESQHFTTELIGRFKKDRKSLPAISLNSDTTAITAIANDYGYDQVFARQVEGLSKAGDVIIGISTSGSSPSVLNALESGLNNNAVCFLLTGNRKNLKTTEGITKIGVGGEITALIQEMHLTLIHIVCELVEDKLGLSEVSGSESLPKITNESDARELDFTKPGDITWVNGCFDLIHEGHLKLLNIASKQSPFLIIGINSDGSVKKIKGSDRPLVDQNSRANALLLLGFVDMVIIYDSDNPLKLLELIKPKFVVKGEEYAEITYPELDFLKRSSVEITYVENVKGLSTSSIIEKARF